jgi:hypothetical protein
VTLNHGVRGSIPRGPTDSSETRCNGGFQFLIRSMVHFGDQTSISGTFVPESFLQLLIRAKTVPTNKNIVFFIAAEFVNTNISIYSQYDCYKCPRINDLKRGGWECLFGMWKVKTSVWRSKEFNFKLATRNGL